MSDKRAIIPESLFNKLYNELTAKEKAKYDKKSYALAPAINAAYEEYRKVKNGEYLTLDEDTKAKIDVLINMKLNNSVDEVVKEAIKFYVDAKKDEMKKLVDSL